MEYEMPEYCNWNKYPINNIFMLCGMRNKNYGTQKNITK